MERRGVGGGEESQRVRVATRRTCSKPCRNSFGTASKTRSDSAISRTFTLSAPGVHPPSSLLLRHWRFSRSNLGQLDTMDATMERTSWLVCHRNRFLISCKYGHALLHGAAPMCWMNANLTLSNLGVIHKSVAVDCTTGAEVLL